MLRLNSDGWKMPVVFEDYVKHFREAHDIWMRLYAALDGLSSSCTEARYNPVLLRTSTETWPTRGELLQMLQEAEAKSGSLLAEFAQLPADVKSYAPAPNTVSHRPDRRGR